MLAREGFRCSDRRGAERDRNSLTGAGIVIRRLHFWLDLASPYSYLAAHRLARRPAVAPLLQWRVFLLGARFRDQGLRASPFIQFPEKGQNAWRDLERRAALHGLKFRRPSHFPQDSLRANRLLWLGLRAGWSASFALAVFEEQFVQGEAIDDLSTLSRILRELNLDPELVRASDGDDARTGLHEETEAVARLGVFGAPSFTVGEELFWGDDRLDEALQWSRVMPCRAGRSHDDGSVRRP